MKPSAGKNLRADRSGDEAGCPDMMREQIYLNFH